MASKDGRVFEPALVIGLCKRVYANNIPNNAELIAEAHAVQIGISYHLHTARIRLHSGETQSRVSARILTPGKMISRVGAKLYAVTYHHVVYVSLFPANTENGAVAPENKRVNCVFPTWKKLYAQREAGEENFEEAKRFLNTYLEY